MKGFGFSLKLSEVTGGALESKLIRYSSDPKKSLGRRENAGGESLFVYFIEPSSKVKALTAIYRGVFRVQYYIIW